MKLQSLAIYALTLIALCVVGFMFWLAWLTREAGSDLGAAGWVTAAFLNLRSAKGMIENIAMGHRRQQVIEGEQGEPQ